VSIQSWILYLTLVFIATATPGPAVLFITTNSLLYGWRKTAFAAIGNIFGLFFLGLIAITGLGAILKTSAAIYSVIKFLGAAYLIYLGMKLLFNGDNKVNGTTSKSATTEFSTHRLFLQAFGIAVTNPKAVVFLTALFPQFLNTNSSLLPQFSALILTLMSSSFFFLVLYSILACKAKGWLSNPGRKRIVNKASGSIFIGFGILLATSSNK
jgi:homoserine/homoserine lactone efflux protein